MKTYFITVDGLTSKTQSLEAAYDFADSVVANHIVIKEVTTILGWPTRTTERILCVRG